MLLGDPPPPRDSIFVFRGERRPALWAGAGVRVKGRGDKEVVQAPRWGIVPVGLSPLHGLFFFFFLVFLLFLGPLPRHMEVPRLGVQSEL